MGEDRPGVDAAPLDVTVVVPVRNGAHLVSECLDSIVAQRPAAIIVVDGQSTDGTLDVLDRWDVKVLDDEGRGLPHARLLGVSAARTDVVALIDADVIVPPGALSALIDEFHEGGYVGLQAAQRSVGAGRYWCEALARHHRHGRSKNWFGLVATVVRRDVVLSLGFDSHFRSGEDIEFRWRIGREGRIGVSERVEVIHRFADSSFAFAKDQFLQDGFGLGAMIRKHPIRASRLGLLPLGAAIRGTALCMLHLRPKWVPYYAAYAAYNYAGMIRGALTTRA